MNSREFISDFALWIRHHTHIQSLYMKEENSNIVFYALISEKKTFLQNSMIFTEYDYTSYCKVYNFDNDPYLEIEFLSGNKAVIKLISSDFKITDQLVELFSR